MGPFQSCPPDAVSSILRFLSVPDIISVSETCRSLRNAVLKADDRIWSSFLPNRSASQMTVVAAQHDVIKHKDRFRNVLAVGEYNDEARSWLVASLRHSFCNWAFIVLGFACEDIAWGYDTRYWKRDGVKYHAILDKVWWFSMSTSWEVLRPGFYSVFVLFRPDPDGNFFWNSPSNPIACLENVDVSISLQSGIGGANYYDLGKLTGNRMVSLPQTSEHESTLIFVSDPFSIEEGPVKLSLEDTNVAYTKAGVSFLALGLAPVTFPYSTAADAPVVYPSQSVTSSSASEFEERREGFAVEQAEADAPDTGSGALEPSAADRLELAWHYNKMYNKAVRHQKHADS